MYGLYCHFLIHNYNNFMNTKLFIVLVILSTLLPQLEASKVVALTEKAILSMRKDYKNLFVKYYVPW